MKVLLAVSMLFLSCSSMLPPYKYYGINTQRDDFNKNTIYRMHGNILAGGPVLGGQYVALNLQLLVTDVGDSLLNIVAVYLASDWIFIPEGESLVLLIDGERVGFTGSGSSSHRGVKTAGKVLERAWYDISREQINDIINANEVRVKLSGGTIFLQRHFGKKNILRYKKFINKYL